MITVEDMDGSKARVFVNCGHESLKAPLVAGMFIWLWVIPMAISWCLGLFGPTVLAADGIKR